MRELLMRSAIGSLGAWRNSHVLTTSTDMTSRFCSFLKEVFSPRVAASHTMAKPCFLSCGRVS